MFLPSSDEIYPRINIHLLTEAWDLTSLKSQTATNTLITLAKDVVCQETYADKTPNHMVFIVRHLAVYPNTFGFEDLPMSIGRILQNPPQPEFKDMASGNSLAIL